MASFRFIEIDGKRYLWRDLLHLRREQKKAHARAQQPALFELKEVRGKRGLGRVRRRTTRQAGGVDGLNLCHAEPQSLAANARSESAKQGQETAQSARKSGPRRRWRIRVAFEHAVREGWLVHPASW